MERTDDFSTWIARELQEQMKGNPDSPWNPAVPLEITPSTFERQVLAWLQGCASRLKQEVDAQHLGVAHGAGGDYKIDVLVKLDVFDGAELVILVECKHQTRPVEREDVMVLEAKLRDVGAHKGMLFSTSGFQKGALSYAKVHGIATISFVDGKSLYETKAMTGRGVTLPPWSSTGTHAGVLLSATDTGVHCHTLEQSRLDALLEWLTDASRRG